MSFLMRASFAISLVACAITIGSVHAALAQNAAEAAHGPPSLTGAPKSRAATPVVAQPRGTGYFVGDKVSQRVLLEFAGEALSPVSLPPPGRVSAWFERRAASIETDTSSHRWLIIEYQILNAPPKLMTVKLPAWSLPIKGGAPVGSDSPRTDRRAPVALAVPAASINIAPLSPPGSPTQVGAGDLRPDRLPPVIATAPIWRSIEMSAGAFCLTLIAWLGWLTWRNGRALATQPFARALFEMRTLEDGEPRAWQVLHRAFDRTAGRVVQHSTLPTLFERAPQLIPARVQIEQFFAQSSLRFFATVKPTNMAPSPRALCAELRQIEKRHER
jgi:mxaA protein